MSTMILTVRSLRIAAYLVSFLCGLNTHAQPPALIPYQAIARNAAGEPLASSTLNARFTIHDGTANGTSVWQELQTVSTSALGLFTVQLGSSVPLSSVNWANGSKFMQVEIDLGNGFVDIGTQQLLSVPYALFSGNAANGILGTSQSGDTLFLSNGNFFVANNSNSNLLPQVSTNPVNNITSFSARFSGYVDNNENTTIIQQGFVWSANPHPTITSNVIMNLAVSSDFDTTLSNVFSAEQTYYVRAFVRTENNIYSYGEEVSFQLQSFGEHTCGATNVINTDLQYGTLTDQEGNNYKTIVIGTQEWMAENLVTSIYRNGQPIITNLSQSEWVNTFNQQTGAWTYYNNSSAFECPYGKLYNWYACVDTRMLCPTGWHVPSTTDWNVLINYLGGTEIAGGKLKSVSTQYWLSPNLAATNESGFSGLPGGQIVDSNGYNSLGTLGRWWSSTSTSVVSASDLILSNIYQSTGDGNASKVWGLSVRCVRD